MCKPHSRTEMLRCISLHILSVTNKPSESLNLVESVSQTLALLLENCFKVTGKKVLQTCLNMQIWVQFSKFFIHSLSTQKRLSSVKEEAEKKRTVIDDEGDYWLIKSVQNWLWDTELGGKVAFTWYYFVIPVQLPPVVKGRSCRVQILITSSFNTEMWTRHH